VLILALAGCSMSTIVNPGTSKINAISDSKSGSSPKNAGGNRRYNCRTETYSIPNANLARGALEETREESQQASKQEGDEAMKHPKYRKLVRTSDLILKTGSRYTATEEAIDTPVRFESNGKALDRIQYNQVLEDRESMRWQGWFRDRKI